MAAVTDDCCCSLEGIINVVPNGFFFKTHSISITNYLVGIQYLIHSSVADSTSSLFTFVRQPSVQVLNFYRCVTECQTPDYSISSE